MEKNDPKDQTLSSILDNLQAQQPIQQAAPAKSSEDNSLKEAMEAAKEADEVADRKLAEAKQKEAVAQHFLRLADEAAAEATEAINAACAAKQRVKDLWAKGAEACRKGPPPTLSATAESVSDSSEESTSQRSEVDETVETSSGLSMESTAADIEVAAAPESQQSIQESSDKIDAQLEAVAETAEVTEAESQIAATPQSQQSCTEGLEGMDSPPNNNDRAAPISGAESICSKSADRDVTANAHSPAEAASRSSVVTEGGQCTLADSISQPVVATAEEKGPPSAQPSTAERKTARAAAAAHASPPKRRTRFLTESNADSEFDSIFPTGGETASREDARREFELQRLKFARRHDKVFHPGMIAPERPTTGLIKAVWKTQATPLQPVEPEERGKIAQVWPAVVNALKRWMPHCS